jgi:hypothetical protein
VISLPVLIHVFVLHLLSAEPFDLRKMCHSATTWTGVRL